MTNVRKMAQTTITLVAVIALVILLPYWSRSLLGNFLYNMNSLLGTKGRIGLFYNIVLSFSFWCFLITPGVEAVLRELNWRKIYEPFIPQLIFSGCIAVWGIIANSTRVSVIWFWIFYHIALFIGIRAALVRISKVDGGGSPKIKLFLKDPLSKNDIRVSAIDRSVICGNKTILMFSMIMLLVSLVALCVQYKQIFGL